MTSEPSWQGPGAKGRSITGKLPCAVSPEAFLQPEEMPWAVKVALKPVKRVAPK